jgi:prepilin-type processing-associated H-X9-DG protein
LNDPGSPPHGFWPERLQPYSLQRWTNELYHCPDYRGLTLPGNRLIHAFPVGSYGYNAHGVKYIWSNLGLAPINNGPDTILPVRESTVVAPSDMIALGDAHLTYIPDYDLWPLYATNGPGAASGSLLLDFTMARYSIEPWLSGWSKEILEGSKKRHRDRLQIVFVDGHVEAVKRETLFKKDDLILKRWNIDNLPHPEDVMY